MRVAALVVAGLVAVVSACSSSDSSDRTGGNSSGGASDGGDAAAGSSGSSGSGGSGGASTGGTSSGGGAGTAGVAGTSGGAGQDGGAGSAGTANDGGSDAAVEAGKLTAASCFEKMFPNASASGLGPDYDQFNPTIGSHCKGTNQQDIKGVQKVVFLGDSVTVGTPPTNINPGAVYRAILAGKLATLFNIKAPGFGWGAADPINGVALPHESGDFVSCAKWGARTDDLMKDNTQVEDCIPLGNRNLHHLVVMTMGGNDIASITQDGGGQNPAKTIPELWAETQKFVQLLRETVEWLKDPVNVPGGVDVVFANNYEFTDATGETNACVLASLGGIEPWQDKQAQADMVIWANEQYMKIATDTKSDMIFMLEAFCGHGYKKDDPTGPCYRGPNTPLWFDVTCIHPNGAGHSALADLFYETVAE